LEARYSNVMDADEIDLMKKMLEMNPFHRITAN
jgi:hypothetical protein